MANRFESAPGAQVEIPVPDRTRTTAEVALPLGHSALYQSPHLPGAAEERKSYPAVWQILNYVTTVRADIQDTFRPHEEVISDTKRRISTNWHGTREAREAIGIELTNVVLATGRTLGWMRENRNILIGHGIHAVGAGLDDAHHQATHHMRSWHDVRNLHLPVRRHVAQAIRQNWRYTSIGRTGLADHVVNLANTLMKAEANTRSHRADVREMLHSSRVALREGWASLQHLVFGQKPNTPLADLPDLNQVDGQLLLAAADQAKTGTPRIIPLERAGQIRYAKPADLRYSHVPPVRHPVPARQMLELAAPAVAEVSHVRLGETAIRSRPPEDLAATPPRIRHHLQGVDVYEDNLPVLANETPAQSAAYAMPTPPPTEEHVVTPSFHDADWLLQTSGEISAEQLFRASAPTLVSSIRAMAARRNQLRRPVQYPITRQTNGPTISKSFWIRGNPLTLGRGGLVDLSPRFGRHYYNSRHRV